MTKKGTFKVGDIVDHVRSGLNSQYRNGVIVRRSGRSSDYYDYDVYWPKLDRMVTFWGKFLIKVTGGTTAAQNKERTARER